MININELHDLYEKYNKYQIEHVQDWQEHEYWDGIRSSDEEVSEKYFIKFVSWLRYIGQ